MARTLLFKNLRSLLLETNRPVTPSPTQEPPPLSRRDFLKASLLAGSALSLAPHKALAKLEKSARKIQPVAIVGLGAAGLTAAYQLQKLKIPFVLFEASSRVGGRVFTDDKTFAGQGQFCELGAELVNSDHTALRNLARELGVVIEDFGAPDPSLLSEIYVHDGIRYSASDVKTAAAPLVKSIRGDLKRIFGKSKPEAITATSPFRHKAQTYDNTSLAQYLDVQTSLPAWFKGLLREAYETENGVAIEKQSVLILFSMFAEFHGEWSTYGSSDETSRIKGGSSKLIEAIFKKIQPRGAVNFKHQLVQVIEKDGKIDLTFQTTEQLKTMTFSQVILGLPLPVLRQVGGFSDQTLKLKAQVHKAIQELQYGYNSKTMLGFSQRIWRKPKKFEPSTGSVLSNLYTSTLWETSRLQKDPAGILTFYAGGKKAHDVALSNVSQMLTDIQALFPGAKDVFNQKTVQFNWPKYPWALGSYCSPAPGQYTTLMGLLHEPFLGHKLFLIGEHTSIDYYGFYDGAIESGQRVAEQIMQSWPEFAA
ncbi:MAG: FAD-dependent oxidoreductase [Bdellovibrio sp.]